MIILKIIFIFILIILDAVAIFYWPKESDVNPLWLLGAFTVIGIELILIFWLVTVVYTHFYGVSPWG